MVSLNKLLSNKYFWSFVLAAILVICLVMEYTKPNLHNLNRDATYYDESELSSDVVISNKLKRSDTLEQDVVDDMVSSTQMDYPRSSPRYHPLLPNAAGSTLVE